MNANKKLTKKQEEMVKSLSDSERKIYDSIMENFPATKVESAVGYAVEGGVRFNFISRI